MLFRANNLTPTPMLLRLRAAAKAPSAGIDRTSSWPPNFINRANPGLPIELRNLEEVLGTTRDFLRGLRIRYVDPRPEGDARRVDRHRGITRLAISRAAAWKPETAAPDSWLVSRRCAQTFRRNRC
jgi:hypothetical protein